MSVNLMSKNFGDGLLSRKKIIFPVWKVVYFRLIIYGPISEKIEILPGEIVNWPFLNIITDEL